MFLILISLYWYYRPESADTSNFQVEDGDVILLATDGVFDNVPDQLLITELIKVQGERDPIKIQGVANSIALMARSLAFDGNFMSPFAQNARENGIDAVGELSQLLFCLYYYYCCYYYYYYYYTIWMSLVTGLFFLVLLLNQR